MVPEARRPPNFRLSASRIPDNTGIYSSQANSRLMMDRFERTTTAARAWAIPVAKAVSSVRAAVEVNIAWVLMPTGDNGFIFPGRWESKKKLAQAGRRKHRCHG